MPYKDKDASLNYHREYNRIYMREDRKKNNAKYRERERKKREDDPSTRLWYATKQSSKLKNLEHSIEKSDIILPEYCPYLGIKIDYTAGNGKNMNKPSVDRIDNSKGYIKGNIEVISSLANSMKNKASIEELQEFAIEILRRYPLD